MTLFAANYAPGCAGIDLTRLEHRLHRSSALGHAAETIELSSAHGSGHETDVRRDRYERALRLAMVGCGTRSISEITPRSLIDRRA
jgi:hypothetical protein